MTEQTPAPLFTVEECPNARHPKMRDCTLCGYTDEPVMHAVGWCKGDECTDPYHERLQGAGGQR